jgi:DNA-binding MarR family transcriptional regulator
MIIEIGSASYEETLRMSRQLFGNQDRLVVAAAVAGAEPGTIYAHSLAEQLGMTDNRVGPQLGNLEAAGLLVRLPKVGGERRVYFERVDSTFWNLCAEFVEEIATRVAAKG